MFVRFLLPLMAAILFLVEPVFALFSPIEMFGETVFLVPRFLFMYLLFLGVYYELKKALIYAAIFGLLYDIVFIDILGLYVVLFPLFVYLINWVIRFIQQTLPVVTVITVLFVALFELLLFEFYHLISITTITHQEFLITRLVPTIIGNFLFLVLLGWLFKYFIKTRLLQSV